MRPLRPWAGLALAAGLAAAQAAGATGAVQGPPEVRFDNGLRVLLERPGAQPALMEALLVVHAGTAHERSGQEGAARLVADALFTGSPGGTDVTHLRRLARQGASVEWTVGREHTVFRLALPEQRALPLLRSLGELLARPSLPPEVWAEAQALRRSVAAQEESDLWGQANRALERLAWRTGAAAPPDGPRPAAGAVPEAAAAEAFRRELYRPDRMVLAVSSPLTAAELRQALAGTLGAMPPAEARPPAEPPAGAPAPGGELRCLPLQGADPPVLLVGVAAEVGDDAGFYGWQVIAHLLAGSHSSRLHRRLRLEEGLVYTVDASVRPVGRRGLVLQVACQTHEVERARSIILEEIARLAAAPASPAELEPAVAIVRSRLLLDAEAPRERLYRRALAALGSASTGLDPAAAETILDAVSPGRIQALARGLDGPGRASTVVVASAPPAICPAGREVSGNSSGGER